MPKLIQNAEQFEKLLPKAQQLRVVRMTDFVKIKLRTPDYLYTYKTNPDEAADLIKSAKDIEVIDYSSAKEKKGSEKKETESSQKEESEKNAAQTKPQRKKRKSSQEDGSD